MTCPVCITGFLLRCKAVQHVHDPSDAFGHGEETGEFLRCTRCGYEEDAEPEERDEE